MSEQHESYRVWGASMEVLLNQLNQIFNLVANRLDRLEGLRGTPTLYTDAVSYPGQSVSGQLTAGTDGESADFSALTTDDISGLGTIATQDADAVAVTGGSISAAAVTGGSLSGDTLVYEVFILIRDAGQTTIHQYAVDTQTSDTMGFF